MIDIFADLNETTINAKVWRQGSAPETLPDEFFTVQNSNTNNNLEADNQVKEVRWDWTVIFYTKDIETLYVRLQEAITLLTQKGYEIDGEGFDTLSKYNGFEARAFDVTKIEKKEN